MSLSRAARCFITYDARNVTVRGMISEYRQKTRDALAFHGEITIEVRPYELAWQGEVVYAEEDRERSLAFRLFRDGIRGFTISPDVSWEELLKLLEILSVRYTSIRQQEDDTLTLLRQAACEKIAFEVVEAFVPAEENPEAALEQQHLTENIRSPAGWDQPLPRFNAKAPLEHRPLEPSARAAILAEASPDALVGAAKQVVREALSTATRVKEEGLYEQVMTLIDEICKFMIVEIRPQELVWVLRETRRALGDTPEVRRLAERFNQAEVLDRFLRDPDDVTADALMPLFDMISGDHLDRVIDRFTREDNPVVRGAIKTILARLAMGNADALLARLGDVPIKRVVDLFNVVCVVAPPERVLEAAYSLSEHESAEVQLGALEVLNGAPVSAEFHQAMERLILSETPRLRIKAAGIYARRGGSRAYSRLRAQLEDRIKTGLDRVEAEVLGRGLVQTSKEAAIPMLRAWIKPQGIKRLTERFKYGEGYRMLRWAAVAGLGELPTDRNRELIAWLEKRVDDEFQQYCREVLGRMAQQDKADG